MDELPVPIVGSIYPQPYYVVAVCVDPDLFGYVRPDDTELDAIRHYRNYWWKSLYRPGYLQSLDDPNVVPGHNTTVFGKRADGRWQFRKATWQVGPTMAPSAAGDEHYSDVVDLIVNRICQHHPAGVRAHMAELTTTA